MTHRPRWGLFLAFAGAIVVADQATKALVTATLQPGESRAIVDNLLRIVFSQNSGALFGLFKDNGGDVVLTLPINTYSISGIAEPVEMKTYVCRCG